VDDRAWFERGCKEQLSCLTSDDIADRYAFPATAGDVIEKNSSLASAEKWRYIWGRESEE